MFLKNLIYNAKITTNNNISKLYIYSKSRPFKTQLYEQKAYFPKDNKNKRKNYSTSHLSM